MRETRDFDAEFLNRDSTQRGLPPAKYSKRPAVGTTITLGLSLAVLIGFGSVANDMFPFSGVFITIMTKLASSGLGFVMIALLVGWFSKSSKIAASVASVSILFALAIYYCAIPVYNLRPSAAGSDIAQIALVWTLLGVGCGVIVGSMAFFAHYGTLTQRSIATGFPLGLILGPVVVGLLQGVDLRSLEILAVVAITGFIPVVGLLASLRRTKPRLLFLSALAGIIFSGGLFLVVYALYY
ncbi:hypothetical protein [Varibaculum sp.]|uniref:hypothetical protein n=1 Tax=Varibaculum sp. TaxID=1895474 RepID=UPI0025E14BAA|nr:hypothetical protein [Varibaculum sp.]